MTLAIRAILDSDVDAVAALWEACGLTRPWNDPHADIALARRTPSSEIFVGLDDDKIVASAMCGSDGHRGWLYYVAVEPALQGNGHGRAIMARAETWLAAQGIPKIELMVRSENTAVQRFYESIGYNIEPVAVMARWLKPKAE
jgi:ribosomal protein S18 acetylase RimI-like enzyme